MTGQLVSRALSRCTGVPALTHKPNVAGRNIPARRATLNVKLIWEGLTRTYGHPTPDGISVNGAVWRNMAGTGVPALLARFRRLPLPKELIAPQLGGHDYSR